MDPAIQRTEHSPSITTTEVLGAPAPLTPKWPSVGKYYGHLGHSHDMSRSTNPLVTTPRLALRRPCQPMLSIGQFRHANLNWYSHSPAYVVGTYAISQVSRQEVGQGLPHHLATRSP